MGVVVVIAVLYVCVLVVLCANDRGHKGDTYLPRPVAKNENEEHERQRKAADEKQGARDRAQQSPPPSGPYGSLNPDHAKVSTAPDAQKASDSRSKTLESIEHKQLLFNGILAGCAVIGLGIATYQGCSIQRQIELARDANVVAQRAAKATEDSNRIASETAESQLKAYVVIQSDSGMTYLPPEEPDDKDLFIASVHVKNTGQTPAYKVDSISGALQAPLDYNGPFDYTLPGVTTDRIVMAAGPGRDWTIEVSYEPNAQDFELIKKGDQTIFVFGTIKYVDAFGKKRCTNFRYRLGDLIEGNDYNLTFEAEGNDADTDDCCCAEEVLVPL